VSATEMLPDLKVEIDGSPLGAAGAASLSSVYLAQRLSMPALCELTFRGAPTNGDELRSCALGSSLRVDIAGVAAVFEGEIVGIGHGYTPDSQHELRLRAYDRLHALRKRRPVRTHVERSVADLARDLLGEIGLDVRIEDHGPVFGRIVQWHQSDLELLAETAQRCGLYFELRGRDVTFVTLEGAGEPESLRWGESLLEANLDSNQVSVFRPVEVRAWNPWDASTHDATAADPRMARGDVAPGSSRAAAQSDSPITLVDRIAQTDAEAMTFAQSELDGRVASAMTVNGVAAGNASLRPGRRVEIGGIAAGFEGPYMLAETVHTIDRELGYRTAFDTAPPEPHRPCHEAVATFGIVIDVDDPEGLGRVRVTLPSYSDIETDWLACVMPGAGPRKGLMALPDIDDRVLLVLPRQDPAQGVVLGGLYGRETPPSNAGVERGRVRSFSYTLPGGQRLHLDEARSTVRLDNGGHVFVQLAPGNARIANDRGSFVELDKDCVRVHANADLELNAPGRSVVFRSAKVDFQTG